MMHRAASAAFFRDTASAFSSCAENVLSTQSAIYLTWWLTAKKGYRFCYNIGYALYVLDAALFVVLMYQSGEMAFIPDLIFHAIVLFGGFKIFRVNSSNAIV